MKKNILLLLLMLCMTVGHAFAQDTLYVMKNGVVTQKLVVGKDVDRITFKAPQPVQTNMAYVNGQEIVLNSALLYSDGGTTYICLSNADHLTDFQTSYSGDIVLIAMPDALFGTDINFETVDYAENPVYAYYLEGGEPIYGASDDVNDWKASFLSATIKADTLNGKMTVKMNFQGNPDVDAKDFKVDYAGNFTYQAPSANYFTIDGTSTSVRKAFVKHEDDGSVTLYLSTGDVETVEELENAYYYAAVNVPQEALDGRTIDVQGQEPYSLILVDNLNNEQSEISQGNAGYAIGSLSVKAKDEGYVATIDVTGLGGTHSLKAYYDGVPTDAATEKPNAIVVNQQSTPLNKAIVASEGDYYNVYFFNDADATANDTARADLSLKILKSEAQGDIVPFTNDGTGESLVITYNGETYDKESVSGDTPNANGGNASMTLDGDQLNITSTVYAAVKEGKHDIKTHFKGKTVVL